MKITVFGAGYVGLVTSACLSELGHQIACVDVDECKIACIQSGRSPIFEPGLEGLIQKGQREKRFMATSNPEAALADANASMIAVGTPDQAGRIDMRYVLQVAARLGEHIKHSKSFHTVIVKSTVIPGSTLGPIREALESSSGKKAGLDFGLGMNPEFLREGFGVEDFMNPDRLVLGALGSHSAEVMQSIYQGFDCPKFLVTPTEAEFIKYTANALLSTLISFSNEIFNLCEATPDVEGRKVLEGALADRRWTPQVEGKRVKPGIQSYVMGGVGYGGSCFPKDMNAIKAMAHDRNLPVPLLDAVVQVNEKRPVAIIQRLKAEIDTLSGRKIAVLGLAFKPGTDDWRNSPSQPLIRCLLKEGALVTAWDPIAGEESIAEWKGRVHLERDADKAISQAHAALIATAWPEIRQWPWMKLISRMAQPLVYDGRNLLSDIQWPKSARYIPSGAGQNELETL